MPVRADSSVVPDIKHRKHTGQLIFTGYSSCLQIWLKYHVSEYSWDVSSTEIAKDFWRIQNFSLCLGSFNGKYVGSKHFQSGAAIYY